MTLVRAPLPFPTLDDPELDVPEVPAEFLAALRGLGLELPALALEKLRGYVALLARASELVNLTAIHDLDAIWMKLAFDSLTLLPHLAGAAGSFVVDVGTGAGIPGLPLAIAAPSLQFTLVDATAKKVGFVRHAIGVLGIPNARALVGRAEELASPVARGSEREVYDFVIARAVAPLPVLLELTVPFAKAPSGNASNGHSGRLLLAKGERAAEELTAARNAMRRLEVTQIATHATPTGQILVFEKLAPTPKGYPRGNGVPKKKPL